MAELHNKEIIDFDEALYRGECPDCGDSLEWEANCGEVGTIWELTLSYNATCSCDVKWTIRPYTVKVSREEDPTAYFNEPVD